MFTSLQQVQRRGDQGETMIEHILQFKQDSNQDKNKYKQNRERPRIAYWRRQEMLSQDILHPV